MDHARATGHGQQSRAAIDVGEADVRRHIERFVAVACKRARHERQPDGQRRLRAAQTERLIFIKTDPYHGEKVGREADEPRIAQVVRGAGLARGVQ